MSDTQSDLNTPIGTEEMKKLEPKDVLVQGIRVDTKTNKDDGKVIGKIVVLLCKHPDSDKVMEFSQVKRLKGNNLKVIGLWYNVDSENRIQKGSVLAETMTFFKVGKLNDFIGKSLPTITQSETVDYLCLKAYT